MVLASSYFDRAGGERPGGEPMSLKLLRDAPFGVVLCTSPGAIGILSEILALDLGGERRFRFGHNCLLERWQN